MIWMLLVLSGGAIGAWLKRLVWARSFGGVTGWVRRRLFHVKQKYKRWRFRRSMR